MILAIPMSLAWLSSGRLLIDGSECLILHRVNYRREKAIPS